MIDFFLSDYSCYAQMPKMTNSAFQGGEQMLKIFSALAIHFL